MASPFYSKWAVMPWAHPSSLRATKCKVWQYAGRQWCLYSMLQESLELYSYFEIQKWMWTYALTCQADCVRLLAGRGMNISHEVWSLSTVIPYNIQQTQGVAAVWKCKANPTYGADLVHWTIIFGPVTRHLQGHQFYSKNNPYPTAFPYGNGMVLHFYQQQESSTTKTVHKVINKGRKAYV